MRARARLTCAALAMLFGMAMLFAGCASPQSPSSKQMHELVEADIAQVMTDIDAAIENDPRVGASSNPFDYVGISPAFGRLVERGEPALETIAGEIETSPDNGLREYLLAMAGNGILGEKGRYAGWDTGKGWAARYRSDH